MAVLVLSIGVLLALFGGGCTLIMAGVALFDQASFFRDLGLMLGIVVPFGFLPLGLGVLLIRKGQAMRRKAREAAAPPANPPA